MSKQKAAVNNRKGGGKKTRAGASGGGRGTGEVRTARRSQSAMRTKASKNSKATGATPAEKRHAGIGRK